MNYMYSIFNNFKYYYNSMNPATLSGAIDVIVVIQPDGTYLSTPFHVRFGKWAVFNIDEKYVDITINNKQINGIKMKLAENGIAFFVEEICDEEEEFPDYLLTSPLPIDDNAKPFDKLDDCDKVQEIDESCRPKEHVDITDPRQTLPFSSSIFSHRKYRSLPDLSFLSKNDDIEKEEIPKKDTIKRKLTTVDPTCIQSFLTFRSIKSPNELQLIDEQPNSSKIKDLYDNESESESENELDSEKMTQKKHILEDGNFSDSEIDHQRFDNNNNLDWKWGNFPKDPKTNLKKEDSKSSYWNWLGWRSKPQLTENHLKNIKTSTVSPKTDSGIGCSTEASPPSTSALSLEMSSNQTNRPNVPKKEVPTPREITNALVKANIVQKQMLYGPNAKQTPSSTDIKLPLKHAKSSNLQSRSRSISGNSMRSQNSFESNDCYTTNGKRYKRTLRLQSDQLKELNLKAGSNDVRFSISNKFQGTAWASCHIYLLNFDEKIVISDIDGTITKSDVLGHIIPAIGGQWEHSHITDLYSKIQNNGYRIIYLSSRAIGQSHQTKKYLSSLIQDSKTLPEGPVLLSPTSVFMAFRKEVIERRPEEFKIACLTDLMSLFPTKTFYAGFGNRLTDIKSYVAVGIPRERILIIDPTGRVENAAHIGFKTNYETMLKEKLVDCFFPPLSTLKKLDENIDGSYNSSYWKIQEDIDNELDEYERTRRQKQLENVKKRSQNNRTRFFSA